MHLAPLGPGTRWGTQIFFPAIPAPSVAHQSHPSVCLLAAGSRPARTWVSASEGRLLSLSGWRVGHSPRCNPTRRSLDTRGPPHRKSRWASVGWRRTAQECASGAYLGTLHPRPGVCAALTGWQRASPPGPQPFSAPIPYPRPAESHVRWRRVCGQPRFFMVGRMQWRHFGAGGVQISCHLHGGGATTTFFPPPPAIESPT